MLADILSLLSEGQTLTVEQTRAALLAMMTGECGDAHIAAFLTALKVRGETVDELVGAASVLREKCVSLPTGLAGVLDTCGTGGDQSHTFNISTAAALVAAACGLPVAKHGNRGVSSSSGSADVLKTLGVNVDVEPATAVACLKEVGIGFFFAPSWHPAMKHVMPVRRQLRFRTIFNMIGPLSNPARADFQVVGVGRADWADKLAEALLRLGAKSATVVTGSDGLDEVTLAGTTRAVCLRDGRLQTETWSADSFGLPGYSPEVWKVSSPAESAAVIRGVFEGRPGPARDIVLANSAAALWTAGKAGDLQHGAALAAAAIDRGAAKAMLEQLIARSQQALSN